MTSIRDAYPTAALPMAPQAHVPPPVPAPHGGGGGSGMMMDTPIPHGPMGGQGAGSMENKLPFKQIDGREPLETFLQQPAQMPQQPLPPGYTGPGPGTQDAAAAALQRHQRQQIFQAQVSAAEAKMRGIAKEENRMQAVGYVAIGMCLVFLAVFALQLRGVSLGPRPPGM